MAENLDAELNAGITPETEGGNTTSTATFEQFEKDIIDAATCKDYQHYDYETGKLAELGEYIDDTLNGDSSVYNPELPNRSMRVFETLDELESHNGYRSRKMLGSNLDELTDKEIYDDKEHASLSISFNSDEVKLYKGMSVKLSVVPEPIYANVPSLVWIAENEDENKPVVKVFSDGTIIAVRPGTATVTAYAMDYTIVTDKFGVKRKINKYTDVKATATVTVEGPVENNQSNSSTDDSSVNNPTIEAGAGSN